jgi:LysM repeat protein
MPRYRRRDKGVRRNRGALIPFVAISVLIVVLAQNGVLSSLLASLSAILSASLSNQNTFLSTPLPLPQPVVSFTSPGNQVSPPSNLPTAYAPTYPSQVQPRPPVLPGGSQPLVPVGVVGVDGQCVVPSGWVAYTIQAGETLAVIAQRYNLTAEQIAAANCLQNPDVIYEAQVLALPGSR